MLGREVMMPCSFIAAPPHDTEPNTGFTTELRDNLREAHNRIREALHTSARTESDISIGESATSHSEWNNWYGYTGQGR